MVITRQLTDSASASTASDIQLGSCVTEIGQGAFSGYTNITDVEFPDSLTTIDDGAFSGSSITSVEFPDSVTTIGNSAFTSCNLSELTIPSGVTSIGDRAFMNNDSLERINVSASTVPALGGDAFDSTNNCTIYVPFDLYEDYMASQSWQEYRSRIYYNGMPFKIMFNTSNSEVSYVKCDDSTIVRAPSQMPSNITATTFGECVTDFDSYAFQRKSLGNITIPSNVKYINKKDSGRGYAFYATTATSISFSEGLEEIGSSAFDSFDCPVAITLPSTLSAMSNYAFASSSITGLTINGSPLLELNQLAFTGSSLNFINISNIKTVNGFRSCSKLETVTISNVEAIGNSSFSDCGRLKNFVLTSNKTVSIGGSAFNNCHSLSSVSLSNVSSIGYGAFQGCSGLTSINIPNGVTSISDNLFGYCRNLEIINLPSGVTSIGSGAFQFCSIRNIKIPNAVETIGNNAFYKCSGLTSIDIPSGVTTLNNIFSGCTSLSSITGCENVSNIVGGAFQGLSALQNFTIPSGITVINDKTFSGCTNLRNVDIPSGVTSIGVNAFTNCSSISTLIIPDSVVSIGNQAFSGCSGLNSILIGRSTPPTIGTNVFAGSICLIYVPQASYDLYVNAENWSTYASRIYYIGEPYKLKYEATNEYGFIRCNDSPILSRSEISNRNIVYADIGSCVSTIGEQAFYYCRRLTSVTIPNSVTSIGASAFYYCDKLTSVTIPNNVTSIDSNAFVFCASLTSVTIPNSVTSIGGGAFNNCYSLASVAIPNSVTSIGGGAFNNTPWWNNYSGDTSNHYGNIIYINDVAYKAASTAITSCTFRERTVTISSSAFYNCSGLTSITIPNSVTSIGDSAFYKCSGLTSATIGSGVTSIGASAFYECRSLTSVTIPNSVTSIGASAFEQCYKLTSVNIPNTVTSINNNAFNNCYALTNVIIPNSVTSIGQQAFQSCSSLESVTIPNSVTSIGARAFYYCRSLTSVTVNATTPPTLGSSAFSNTNDCPIYVPSASVDAYKAASGWSDYASRIQAIPT